MDLQQALTQVSEIRDHLARTEVFRGYRAAPVGFSGIVGLAAAVLQGAVLRDPMEELAGYLTIWFGAAGVSVAVIGAALWGQTRASQSAMTRRLTARALEQFLPTLAAGALLTLVVAQRASESAWMLPGLWATLFSLGIFASCRQVSRNVAIAGLWYLVCGVLSLAWGQGESALSPWSMGAAFGGGQLLTALILHLSLEREPQAR